MATTSRQDRDFLDSVISSSLLEDALFWIEKNMEPADVFSEKVLEAWAVGHGMTLEDR